MVFIGRAGRCAEAIPTDATREEYRDQKPGKEKDRSPYDNLEKARRSWNVQRDVLARWRWRVVARSAARLQYASAHRYLSGADGRTLAARFRLRLRLYYRVCALHVSPACAHTGLMRLTVAGRQTVNASALPCSSSSDGGALTIGQAKLEPNTPCLHTPRQLQNEGACGAVGWVGCASQAPARHMYTHRAHKRVAAPLVQHTRGPPPRRAVSRLSTRVGCTDIPPRVRPPVRPRHPWRIPRTSQRHRNRA